MQYIILTPAGHAYQRNCPAAIVACRNWKWATKFDSIDSAIDEMKKVERARYRVVEWPKCTNVVAQNGELKQFSQLPNVGSFFR